LEKRPPDIRLSKKSLLKSGLRADFLEESEEVKKSTWFRRYLEGEHIEFYVEGSGGYSVASIDLISHEIYLCTQTEYADATDALREGLATSWDFMNSVVN
jgi:hypothetical protein